MDVSQASDIEDIAELAADTDGSPLEADRARVVARFSPRSQVKVGDKIHAAVTTEQLHLFDAETGRAVRDE
jgi:multiple sugar transport system ATP-binding protein